MFEAPLPQDLKELLAELRPSVPGRGDGLQPIPFTENSFSAVSVSSALIVAIIERR